MRRKFTAARTTKHQDGYALLLVIFFMARTYLREAA